MDTILATVATDDGPVFLEQAVTVGCSLMASLSFDSVDGPSLNRTVRTHSAGFIIDGIGFVVGDVYVDYTSLTLPAEIEPLGMARGDFAGAGLFYPADPAEELARIDDSEALRWYTVTTSQNIPVQYAVEAFFMLDLFDQEERDVLLADGRDGANMQIRLDAAGSGAGSLTDFSNEIVAYNWTFSDGDSGNGDVITKTLSRDLSSLTITLEVVDRLGNWARYIETLTIVRLSGSFAFPYEPSGILTSAIPWDVPSAPPPPEFFGDGYLVFVTNPADSFIEVNLTGGRNTSAAADSSTVGIPQDEEVSIYNIGYVSSGGLPFE